MHAGGRPADGDLLELLAGHSQQADLGVRGGVQRVWQRRDPQLRAGQQVGAVQRARHAPRRRRPAEGGLLGDDPLAAERERPGARAEHRDASQHQPAAQPAVVVWLRSAMVLRCRVAAEGTGTAPVCADRRKCGLCAAVCSPHPHGRPRSLRVARTAVVPLHDVARNRLCRIGPPGKRPPVEGRILVSDNAAGYEFRCHGREACNLAPRQAGNGYVRAMLRVEPKRTVRAGAEQRQRR